MNSRLIVVGLVEKNGKFLLGKKPDNVGPYPNSWHIPGGGVDLENESLEEALRRELREETEVEVSDIEWLGFDEDNEPNKHGKLTHYVFLDFKAQYESGEAKAGDDMSIIKWVSKEELKELDLNKVSRKFLLKLGLLD